MIFKRKSHKRLLTSKHSPPPSSGHDRETTPPLPPPSHPPRTSTHPLPRLLYPLHFPISCLAGDASFDQCREAGSNWVRRRPFVACVGPPSLITVTFTLRPSSPPPADWSGQGWTAGRVDLATSGFCVRVDLDGR